MSLMDSIRRLFDYPEEDEYEEKHISLSGEKILSWAIDGDVYRIHYGISCLSICGSSNG